MQTPYAKPSAAPARRDGGLRLARVLVTLYFSACALHGLWRLRMGGGSPDSFAAVLRLWYGEALVFGAVFGLVALLHGLVRGGGGGAKAPRHVDPPTRGNMLRAIERDRGR